jgi:hypothetical protein
MLQVRLYGRLQLTDLPVCWNPQGQFHLISPKKISDNWSFKPCPALSSVPLQLASDSLACTPILLFRIDTWDLRLDQMSRGQADRPIAIDGLEIVGTDLNFLRCAPQEHTNP